MSERDVRMMLASKHHCSPELSKAGRECLDAKDREITELRKRVEDATNELAEAAAHIGRARLALVATDQAASEPEVLCIHGESVYCPVTRQAAKRCLQANVAANSEEGE